MLIPAPRPRLVFPGLLLLTIVTGVIGSLGAPLIPEIAHAEGVSLTAAQWALTATMLVGAVASPVIGRIGTGRRRRGVMLVTLGLVALGALLAALPLGFAPLVAGRALQGVGFALGPLALSVARDTLPPREQRTAVSTLSVANVVSVGLGFPVTALTAEWFGVAGAFWLGFALTVFALLVALVTVPGSAEPAPGSVDWVGAALLGSATFCMLLAISQADVWGYVSVRTLGLLAVSVVLFLVCVRWLLYADQPLVDLRVAARRGVAGPHVVAVLAGCGMYVMVALVMVLVQAPPEDGYGLGLPVTVAGLMLTPYAVASVVGNRWALSLGPRIGPDLLLPLGCALFGVANLMFVFWHAAPWQLALVMAVAGIGSGMTFNAIPWLMFRVVPAAETGSAMSFNVVLRYLGFAAGSALALAVLQVFTNSGGFVSEQGFVAGGWVGFAISILAAAVCMVLAPRAAHDDG